MPTIQNKTCFILYCLRFAIPLHPESPIKAFYFINYYITKLNVQNNFQQAQQLEV